VGERGAAGAGNIFLQKYTEDLFEISFLYNPLPENRRSKRKTEVNTAKLKSLKYICNLKEERKPVREFTVVIEQDEDGIYVASVPELPGCHTQAETLDELIRRIKEAIELYLEVEA
jgi:predicted RNase H-like HicB family nuclease